MNWLKVGIVGTIVTALCCFTPLLVIILSAASLAALDPSLDTVLLLALVICIGMTIYGLWRKAKCQQPTTNNIILQSVITCPFCGFVKEETMPTDACQYFYECTRCHQLLKPKQGDCCVYCSYGTVKCPPIQQKKGCCTH